MELEKWITVNSNGIAKLSVGKPAIGWDEISIKINLTIPDEIFVRPHLEASITIPDDAAVSSPITAEVVENAKDAIEKASGMKFDIKVINETTP